jgi:aspartate carbamoyltransferase catalytic subunit
MHESGNAPHRGRRGALSNTTAQRCFVGQDILSVQQSDRDRLEHLFALAEEMRTIVKREGSSNILRGRVLACLFNAKLRFVSPESLRMPPTQIDELASRGIPYKETTSLNDVMPEVDVL